MHLQILPLSEIQSFAYQKCILPPELYPKHVPPGVLAKCTDSKGTQYMCNIFPMSNREEEDICWLDGTIRVGSSENFTQRILKSVEVLHGHCQPASQIDLVIRVSEDIFEKVESPSRDLLCQLSRELLKPYSLVNNCTVDLEDLRELGITEIRVRSDDSEVFSIADTTHVEISKVIYHPLNEKYTPRKLEAKEEPRRELENLLHSATTTSFLNWRMKPSLNALVIGTHGSGKTSLCMNFIVENNCNSYVIRATDVLGQYPGESESELRRIFNTVRRFVDSFKPEDPMVVLIEDLDLICPSSRNSSSDNSNYTRVCGQLILLLDQLHYSCNSSKIIVLATTSRPDVIHSAFRRPGRFGIEINIQPLTEEQRGRIFRSMMEETFFSKSIDLTDDLVETVARQTHGFVASDIELLVNSIAQEFIRKEAKTQQFVAILERSLKMVKPSSFNGSDVMVYKVDDKFRSIGGMENLKKVLDVSVLAGLRNKAAFERFGLCLPKGILLYGPPGCAKTTVAKCLAAEANMTLIPVTAAEVYSPYVGNSEKFISKIFDTARKNAPCLVFFDEIDSLVGRRTADSRSDIHTRILSVLLTEMDGIGVKLYTSAPEGGHIMVVAATNRPDMIDDALIRPGRFDKLIHVPAPDYESRLRILELNANRMPFANDVDLAKIAAATSNFSGADICNLCNEAAMNAFTKDINVEDISMEDFRNVLSCQKSSLTRSQIEFYEEFESKYKR